MEIEKSPWSFAKIFPLKGKNRKIATKANGQYRVWFASFRPGMPLNNLSSKTHENMTTIYLEPSVKQLKCFTNIILIITP